MQIPLIIAMEKIIFRMFGSFNKRPSISTLEGEKWQQELTVRLAAMELAMKKLDEEGLFEVNQARDSVCILVEVMPPEKITQK